MDQIIISYIHKHFTNTQIFQSERTIYLVGYIHGNRYMISKQELYIITKLVDKKDLYIAVCVNMQEVMDLLNQIKNQENIVPNERAKILSSITGVSTI